MLTLFGYVLKNLGRQKLRTALSSIGIMLGVWLVVVFSALAGGSLHTAESMLTEFGEDFHCYKRGVADPFLSSLPEKKTRQELMSVPGVARVSAVSLWFSQVPPMKFVYLVGLRPHSFALASLLKRGRGGFSGPDAKEVILGGGILRRLGLKIGSHVNLEGDRYRVAGTFLTGKPLYDNAVVVPLERLRDSFRGKTDSVNFFAVKVKPGASRNAVQAAVEKRYPGLATVSTVAQLEKVDQRLKRMKVVETVITVAATLLGALFVMLAMVMAVIERIPEVGILRAMGWTKRRIVALVLVEAVFLTFVGVACGIPTGFLGVKLVAHLTDIENFIRPAYEASLYVRTFVVALLAATIGGIYPAWRAARLHPVEAIRHE